MAWMKVAATQDVAAGHVKAVQAGAKQLALCHVGEAFFAVDDLCTHDDGPLADGRLDGSELECPRHGARFDVRTGAVTCFPAVIPIRSYPVRVVGHDVEVDVPC